MLQVRLGLVSQGQISASQVGQVGSAEEPVLEQPERSCVAWRPGRKAEIASMQPALGQRRTLLTWGYQALCDAQFGGLGDGEVAGMSAHQSGEGGLDYDEELLEEGELVDGPAYEDV
ncbi:hypothetical protein NDU88_002191 [Pleurodeles waltl]|uniref:Uncharacterized protein n=1 Tax=Pleurodeles waltl TaxID=8319 RepID=A0AAV7KUN0_PLEWA|nr:hypothetical protein NDU88_002191 [Pleurodeles waltl]